MWSSGSFQLQAGSWISPAPIVLKIDSPFVFLFYLMELTDLSLCISLYLSLLHNFLTSVRAQYLPTLCRLPGNLKWIQNFSLWVLTVVDWNSTPLTTNRLLLLTETLYEVQTPLSFSCCSWHWSSPSLSFSPLESLHRQDRNVSTQSLMANFTLKQFHNNQKLNSDIHKISLTQIAPLPLRWIDIWNHIPTGDDPSFPMTTS